MEKVSVVGPKEKLKAATKVYQYALAIRNNSELIGDEKLIAMAQEFVDENRLYMKQFRAELKAES